MKKYFTYVKTEREVCKKPCIVDYEGTPYTSFCNSFSLALTKESCGTIELFTDKDRYPNVVRLIRFDGIERTVDLHKVFAEAKSKGYKLKSSELDSFKYKYVMHYNGAYYKLGLIDATYAIIDDGKPAAVFHDGKNTSPIVINTSIGVCMALPMRIKGELPDDVTVIEVDI